MSTEPAPKAGPMHRLRNYLLTGILVSAPIALTVYIVIVFLNFVDGRVAEILPAELYPQEGIPGFGLVVSLVFFVLIGWLATNFLGRMIIRASEAIVDRMPVIRSVYGGLKQVFEMVMGNQAKAFREAVLVPFPHKDIWALGFVTGTTMGEVQNKTSSTVVNVFVPTTPNPTSGFLVFVPEESLIRLGMPVDDAIKMVVSGGILTPPDRSRQVIAVEPKGHLPANPPATT